jgi:hypothetical protein
METNTECFTKQLKQKTVEINECQSFIHEQNQLIKNLQTKPKPKSTTARYQFRGPIIGFSSNI